jgi:hypothetical protein
MLSQKALQVSSRSDRAIIAHIQWRVADRGSWRHSIYLSVDFGDLGRAKPTWEYTPQFPTQVLANTTVPASPWCITRGIDCLGFRVNGLIRTVFSFTTQMEIKGNHQYFRISVVRRVPFSFRGAWRLLVDRHPIMIHAFGKGPSGATVIPGRFPLRLIRLWAVDP